MKVTFETVVDGRTASAVHLIDDKLISLAAMNKVDYIQQASRATLEVFISFVEEANAEER